MIVEVLLARFSGEGDVATFELYRWDEPDGGVPALVVTEPLLRRGFVRGSC